MQVVDESAEAGRRVLSLLEASPIVRDMMKTPMNAELVYYAGNGLKLSASGGIRLTDVY
jgi:hypothetical protein